MPVMGSAAHTSEFVSLHSLEKEFQRASKSIARCCSYLKIREVRQGNKRLIPRSALPILHDFFASYSSAQIRRLLAEDALITRYGDSHYNNRAKSKATRLLNLQGNGLPSPLKKPQLLGPTLIQKRLFPDFPGVSLFQIRNVLAYLGLPSRIGECEFLKVREFYLTHRRDEIKRVLTENTCFKKYGARTFMELPEYRENVRIQYNSKTVGEKAAIAEKRRRTNRVLFGADNWNETSEHREYMKAHWRNNIPKGRKTCLALYGKESYSQTGEFKERVREARAAKSPEDLARESEKRRSSLLSRSSPEKMAQKARFRETWVQRRDEERLALEISLGFRLTGIANLAAHLNRDLSTLHAFIRENGIPVYESPTCNYIPCGRVAWIVEQYHARKTRGVSQSEKAIVEYIRTFYSGIVLENVKGVLEGKTELDIYIPDKHLAIEFNGCYWHSDAVGVKIGEVPPRDHRLYAKWRHFEKCRLCTKKGIRLIHVFEDDFQLRREIVFSIIRNAMGFSPARIFARKCILQDVPLDTYRAFLDDNHIQGYSYADARKGLYYNGELVEVIGINSKGTHSAEPELVRLCSRKFTVVPGGFSRLLSAFTFPRLVSYIDLSVFGGGGYAAAGFLPEHVNRPVYFYVKYGQHERWPRTRYMRRRIAADFDSGALKYYNPGESEAVNMYKNGFYRIWNCGTIKVVRTIRGPRMFDKVAARAEAFALMDKNKG